MNEKHICLDCLYFDIESEYYCKLHNVVLGELGFNNSACDGFELKVFKKVDVSGYGYDTEIKNVLTGKQYGVNSVVNLLNTYYYEIQRLKHINKSLTEDKKILIEKMLKNK